METLDRLSMPITECGCHAWLGKIGTGGYAYMSYYTTPGKRVHRKAATVAWELANARERPEGLEIDHIAQCRMPWCVNPDHLRLATRSENSLNRAPYRYIENCVHCGEPKKFYADWVKPEWRCPNYNEHVRSGNTKLPTSNSLKRRGKNGPKPQL
jgi:hypothetical protein